MTLIKKGSDRHLQSKGRLQTDKYGLSTATAVWWDSADEPTLPTLNSAHPVWSSLRCEGVNATHEQTHWTVEGRYAGVFGAVEPVYELCESMAEEPIETHPRFQEFATADNGYTVDKTDGSFVGFVRMPLWDPALDVPTPRTCTNPQWVGVRAYLSPGATWRKTYVTSVIPNADITELGKVMIPLGGSPPSSGRTWLYMGLNYEQRGAAYVVRQEWRLSDRNGWNTTIYTSGG